MASSRDPSPVLWTPWESWGAAGPPSGPERGEEEELVLSWSKGGTGGDADTEVRLPAVGELGGKTTWAEERK